MQIQNLYITMGNWNFEQLAYSKIKFLYILRVGQFHLNEFQNFKTLKMEATCCLHCRLCLFLETGTMFNKVTIEKNTKFVYFGKHVILDFTRKIDHKLGSSFVVQILLLYIFFKAVLFWILWQKARQNWQKLPNLDISVGTCLLERCSLELYEKYRMQNKQILFKLDSSV